MGGFQNLNSVFILLKNTIEHFFRSYWRFFLKLNVAYSCNSAYIHHTGISLISLFENNKDFQVIEVFFIGMDTTEEDINSLKKICDAYNRMLTVLSFDTLCSGLIVNTVSRHAHTIFAKLFFSRISGIDKILYIDSDTIIDGPLDELWEIELEDNFFAGVNVRAINPADEFSLPQDAPYINDGVTLVNLTACRASNMVEKVIEYMQYYKGNPPLLSEGTVNKLSAGHILVLHPKFNLMSGLIGFRAYKYSEVKTFYSEETIAQAIKKPVIIHYLAAFYGRPWSAYCTHPLKDRYLYYKSISEWSELPLTQEKLPLRLKVIALLYDFLPANMFDWLKFHKKKLSR